MKRKKSKFFTFVFSLLPGAGHMYLGFMKMGLSLMAAFFSIIYLSSWLDIGPLLFILPIIWFYSFFDCMNRRYSTDEAFAQLEDRYLFPLDGMSSACSGFFKKRRFLFGVILVLFGVYILWNNMLNHLYILIPEGVYNSLTLVSRMAPQLLVGALILGIGIRLIVNKKKAGEDNV